MLELDHHCHWLGTCLGLRNYHSFYWYLVHLVLLIIYQLCFTPAYMWRLYETRDIEERSEEFLFTWIEWAILPIVFIYGIAMGSWVFKLFYFHQCYVTTDGLTAYEMIKQVHINFDTSPHKRGTSCANFCRMVCCSRRVLNSRLDY